MKTRLAPVLLLLVASPLTAEFLLGDQYLAGGRPAAQLGMLILMIALYGSAAVLLRELARRLRLGWAGLLLLALAYGVAEEGLITQSLFNPHYAGYELLAPGHIDALGIGVPWTSYVLTLHVVWSMATPILIVETWSARRGDHDACEPWLGRVGIALLSVLLVLGAGAIFVSGVAGPDPFLARPAQLAGAAAVAVALLLVALSRRGRVPAAGDAAASPMVTWRSLTVSVVAGALATSAFQAGYRLLNERLPWISVLVMAALWVAALLIMNAALHGRLPGSWRPAPYGLAIGAVISYAWVGLLPAIGIGPAAVIEQAVLIIGYLVLLGLLARRTVTRPGSAARPERSPAPR